MNKQQYAAIIERQHRQRIEDKRKKIRATKKYKDLKKKSEKTYEQYQQCNKQLNELLGSMEWERMKTRVSSFKVEWDEISLILDVKRRQATKVKLLKKYDLYR